MPGINDTPNLEDTQNTEVNAGTQPAPTVPPVENKKEEDKKYSQEMFDSEMKKTRLATEKETKKRLLAQLGLTLEDEEKLNAYKQAYQDSLSEEEKRNNEISELQATNLKLSQDIEEKDYVIKALIKLSNKTEADVEKIVKMAKGLKTEDNTIEDAIDEVMAMIVTPENKPTEPQDINPNMPKGNEIQQPSQINIDSKDNPFKAGQLNLTKQGQLLRENPELAKKLAAEAGVKLNF